MYQNSGRTMAKQSAERGLKIQILTEETDMSDIFKKVLSIDNGGRRSGGDRRNYSYTLHIPERRSGKDRRSGEDRRKAPRIKIFKNQ